MAEDSNYPDRRRFLAGVGGLAGAVTLAPAARAAEDGLSFPGEDPEIRIVFQVNRDDSEYYGQLLFSMGEILRQLDNQAQLVAVGFGPGLGLLLKEPPETVSTNHSDRIESLMAYDVSFRACRNTMEAMEVADEDLLDGIEPVPAGVLEMAQLQQEGYSYVAW
ncbi:MAG: DsrE family protein [Thiohalorhabdus sp.]|uniref:DsrE family protein n=1 Tax=Thiohalorhabdus sp. TaxID=3094134 RepID=UPI00397F82AA